MVYAVLSELFFLVFWGSLIDSSPLEPERQTDRRIDSQLGNYEKNKAGQTVTQSIETGGESSAWCYNLAGVPNTVTMATWSSQSSECITICRSTKKNLWVRPSVCLSMHTDIFLIFFIVWFVGFSKNRVFGWERFLNEFLYCFLCALFGICS